MHERAVGTAALQVTAAAMQMLLGLAIHLFPEEFGASAYDPIRPYFAYITVALMAAGVSLLHWRGSMPPVWQKVRAVGAALPLLVLTLWMAMVHGWSGVVLYGAIAVALSASPWWPNRRHEGLRQRLLAVTGAVIVGLTGLLMLLRPGAFAHAMYAPLAPWLPLVGLGGIVGAAALLSPFATRWQWAWLQRCIGAVLPALMTYNWIQGGYWSGIMGWGVLTAGLLCGDLFPETIVDNGASAQGAADEASVQTLERTLERWSWLLAVLVVATLSLSAGAFARPLFAHLFVMSVVCYNAVVHGMLPGLGTTAQRVSAHLVYLVLLGGLLHVSAGPAGHGYLTLLVAVPPWATQVFGIKVGRRFLGLAAAVVIGSEAIGWSLDDGGNALVYICATVLQVVLLLVAANVGMHSADASRAQKRRLETALQTVKDSEQKRSQLAAILEAMPDLVGMADVAGNVIYTNPAGRKLVGLPADGDVRHQVAVDHPDWVWQKLREEAWPAAVRDGYWRGESVLLNRHGEEIPVLQTIIAHRNDDGEVAYYSTIMRDITEQKRLEEQLTYLAEHDPLTGLPNRRYFNAELARQIDRARVNGGAVALLLIDLDEFKQVNDTLGHATGDKFLSSVARLLQEHMCDNGTVARFGGDEFAIILPAHGPAQAEAAATELLDRLRQHTFLLDGRRVGATISVGIACYPAHGATADVLLTRADVAMYEAKGKGRNMVAICSAEGDWYKAASSLRTWDERIRQALADDRFVLMCQPVQHIGSGQTVQYELLLRMLDDDGSLVAPEEFIRPAEKLGLIHDIDRWVVRKTLHMLASHQGSSAQQPRFAVNLSARTFSDPVVVSLIEEEFCRTGADPERLTLEITETAAVTDIDEARQFMARLQRLGCHFAIDDFGTGYSSYQLLRRLPVQVVKLDRSLIANLLTDAADREFVRALTTIAHHLGQRVVAEGVEDEQTLALLQFLNVDYAQGYFLGRPQPLTACGFVGADVSD